MWLIIGHIWGLFKDNGNEHGNYYLGFRAYINPEVCVLLSSSPTGCAACTNLGRFDMQVVPGGPILGISQSGGYPWAFSDAWGLSGDYMRVLVRESVEKMLKLEPVWFWEPFFFLLCPAGRLMGLSNLYNTSTIPLRGCECGYVL